MIHGFLSFHSGNQYLGQGTKVLVESPSGGAKWTCLFIQEDRTYSAGPRCSSSGCPFLRKQPTLSLPKNTRLPFNLWSALSSGKSRKSVCRPSRLPWSTTRKSSGPKDSV